MQKTVLQNSYVTDVGNLKRNSALLLALCIIFKLGGGPPTFYHHLRFFNENGIPDKS